MSVLIETSFGDITVDLFTNKAPSACINFIKLCKLKHYNNALFAQVQKANPGPNLNDSSFFITLTRANLSSLSGKHTVFGKVEEGLDILRKISDTYVDQLNRPHMNIRIMHTFVLEDPFDDRVVPGLAQIQVPNSPPPARDADRLQAVQHLEMLQKCKTQKEIVQATNFQKAKKQALTLEILGDLPDADLKPPDNILFICNLNSVTQERDLQIIFSRFGPIKSVEIIRDWKTGQSLQYGFIEFEGVSACEEAYLKMNNVLIDQRRVKVNFSQSVSKLMPKNRGAGSKGITKPIVERKQHIKEAVTKTTAVDGKRYYGSEKFDFVAPKSRVQSGRALNEDRIGQKQRQLSKQMQIQQQRQRPNHQNTKQKQQGEKMKKKKKSHRRSPSSSSRSRSSRRAKKRRSDSERSDERRHKKNKEKGIKKRRDSYSRR